MIKYESTKTCLWQAALWHTCQAVWRTYSSLVTLGERCGKLEQY